MHQTCESCGARIDAGAEVCNLCGTPTEIASNDDVERDAEADSLEVPVRVEGTSFDPECDTCGHSNPDGSRFCNRCGSRLVPSRHSASDSSRPKAIPASEGKPGFDLARAELSEADQRKGITHLEDDDRAVGKQVIIVVSAALLLVVVLYVVTVMSGGSAGDFSAVAQPQAGEQTIEPLASQWQDREDEIMAEMESASTVEDRIDARRRLIDLYFAADRLDFAADQTALIAEATQSEEEWILAGNLYFDWMQRAPQSQKAPWAQKAVAAYQGALAINPDNLDVRTDMAIAYMYDPQNSMMAIQETNRVLESDSLHIQANFNRGIMLSQINRLDQAIEQFETVKRIIGDPSDPVYQRAENAIASLPGS